MKKGFLIALGLVAGCASVFGQSLPPDAINAIKKATVYIQVNHRLPLSDDEVKMTGTGFFISKRGHIVTSGHVISPVYATPGMLFPAPVTEIRIIRDSGAKQHGVLHGFVMAVDKENDLALLGVNEAVETPFVDIGAPGKLIETAPTWIFGYPFGEAFAVIQKGPEITVNKGFVSALRHDDTGRLMGIQIDAAINPGSSGGPAIDEAGKVIGIVSTVLFGSHMAFAVPSHLVNDLVKGVRLDAVSTNAIKLSVASEPAGTSVFVDWRSEGSAPLRNIAVKPGWHTLYAAKPGFDAWMSEQAFFGPTNITVSLPPCRDLQISAATGGKKDDRPAPDKPDAELQKLVANGPADKKTFLLSEDFGDQDRFEKWEQFTGGNEKRTWFLEQGAVHQFESDQFLHAIYFGDRSWDNYVMKSDVRISDKHDDSRAGLIFRDTDDGFYLFRIHKESNKAQLAYHCKSPFGWFVVTEKNLDMKISNQWFSAAACVAGDTINCFVNDRHVLAARSQYAGKGRAGFYSVESKASFANLRIFPLRPAKPGRGSPAPQDMLMFWFQDNFGLKSTWWRQYAGKDQSPAPWWFSDAGCVQMVEDANTRYSEFTRYRMADFRMDVLVTLGKGNTNSVFGIFFRKTDQGRLVLSVSNKDRKARLVAEAGDSSRTIKEEDLDISPFGRTARLRLILKGDSVTFGGPENETLSVQDKDLPMAPGRFGFMMSNLRAIFHEMTISSVQEETEENE